MHPANQSHPARLAGSQGLSATASYRTLGYAPIPLRRHAQALSKWQKELTDLGRIAAGVVTLKPHPSAGNSQTARARPHSQHLRLFSSPKVGRACQRPPFQRCINPLHGERQQATPSQPTAPLRVQTAMIRAAPGRLEQRHRYETGGWPANLPALPLVEAVMRCPTPGLPASPSGWRNWLRTACASSEPRAARPA